MISKYLESLKMFESRLHNQCKGRQGKSKGRVMQLGLWVAGGEWRDLSSSAGACVSDISSPELDSTQVASNRSGAVDEES